MSWSIIWAYIIGSLVYHGQLSNVTWIALMIFDSAGIIRLIHEDAREVKPMERLMTLREVLMSWTIYVTLKYATIIPDIAFGWLPIYSAVRWTFFALFISTRTRSARPIFIAFIKPLCSKYETQIDLFLELVSATTALITYYTHRYPTDAYSAWCRRMQLDHALVSTNGEPWIHVFALPIERRMAQRRSARRLEEKARVVEAARMAATKVCARISEAQKQAHEAHRIATRREREPRSIAKHIGLVREDQAHSGQGPIAGRQPEKIKRAPHVEAPVDIEYVRIERREAKRVHTSERVYPAKPSAARPREEARNLAQGEQARGSGSGKARVLGRREEAKGLARREESTHRPGRNADSTHQRPARSRLDESEEKMRPYKRRERASSQMVALSRAERRDEEPKRKTLRRPPVPHELNHPTRVGPDKEKEELGKGDKRKRVPLEPKANAMSSQHGGMTATEDERKAPKRARLELGQPTRTRARIAR